MKDRTVSTEEPNETNSEDKLTAAEEVALDSLHCLPLTIIPIEHAGLRKAIMRKNFQLENVIELFGGAGTGRGQISVSELPHFFSQNDGMLSRDMRVLSQLEPLRSFDVFTLRVEFRKMDIGFEQFDALNLSQNKRQELSAHMRFFTRPLMQRVYGDEENENADVAEIIARVASPDKKEAIERLTQIANEIGVDLEKIPEFLESYGDVFLSLSYYRECVTKISGVLNDFRPWLRECWREQSSQRSPQDIENLKNTEKLIDDLMENIRFKFRYFDIQSKRFWKQKGEQSFDDFRKVVLDSHVGIAAVLCGLAVKLERWSEVFPSAQSGGIAKRIDFVKTEFRANLASLKTIGQQDWDESGKPIAAGH